MVTPDEPHNETIHGLQVIDQLDQSWDLLVLCLQEIGPAVVSAIIYNQQTIVVPSQALSIDGSLINEQPIA